LYHATAILSCRARSWDETAYESNAIIRQRLSAVRVPLIISQELDYDLPFFPFVPYAVLLSSGVAYCEMRRSAVSLSRARAQLQFRQNCSILRELGSAFWSAAETADLGEATLRKLDKASATMPARFR